MPSLRPLVWAGLGLAGAFVALYLVTPGHRLPPSSDGFYSWLIARSLAFDGDVHFANDYALCGDPFRMNRDAGGGRPSNPFYLGQALLWAPVLWLVSGLQALFQGTADPACKGSIPRVVLASTPLWSALALVLAGWTATRFTRERIAVWAVVLTGLGTAFVHFATVNPAYSHAYAALGVALVLAASRWADDRDGGGYEALGRWIVVGLACGVSGLMRTQGLVFLLIPALLLFPGFLGSLKRGAVPTGALLRGGAVLVACFAVFSVQILYNFTVYGQALLVTQGEGYVMLGRPRLAALLWGARGGLFAWHPLLYLSALGGLLLLWRQPKWGWALFLPVALDTWVDASVSDWHGAATFGARRMVAHAPIWVVSMAVALEAVRLERWRRVAPYALVGLFLVFNVGASSGNPMHRTPFKRGARPSELWSVGLSVGLESVEALLGNPFALPASLPFALRYRLPPGEWDRFTSGGVYIRYFTTPSSLRENYLALGGDGGMGQRFDGFEGEAKAARLAPGSRGRALLEVHWPIATHLQIVGRSQSEGTTKLRVRSYGPLLSRGEIEVDLTSEARAVVSKLPPGFIDAGINELVFEVEDEVELRTIRLEDRAYPTIPY